MKNDLAVSYPFITPLWQCHLPNFSQYKESFLKTVYEFKRNNESVFKSNVGGGYQSPFHLMQQEELSPLYDYILEQSVSICGQLDITQCDIGISGSWVNFNTTRSASNILHNHEGILSGIFYLKVPNNSGHLVIQNPGMNTLWEGFKFVRNRNEMTGELVNVTPEEGKIVIWQSHIMHGVFPNDHDEERISIAFNISGIPLGFLNKNQDK
jgi:uncharacterized protein (TIGR02466 family)